VGAATRALALAIPYATATLTELVTNNAAAVLVFPIAMAVAASTGLEPRELAMAVAVTASASFLTPIGYQTNTMVYGPGGYRFTDYLRLGLPLNLVVITTVVTIVTLT
jgi:di/tricarboxylate transporter